MIEIKQWIKPDITKVLPNENAYSSDKYNKFSVLIKQQIMIIHACDEEGNVTGYRNDGKYYGLRMDEDIIQVCIPKFGWIPVYDAIQEIYNSEIAEQAILGGE